jgi:pyruvate-ferredoxin/flavodoxin oxidoreductase
VLDRTKEAGAAGDPLYVEVMNAIQEGAKLGLAEQPASQPIVLGGRCWLSSKEFTPAMIKAVYDNLASRSHKDHFTVGIQDDLLTTPFGKRRFRRHAAVSADNASARDDAVGCELVR